MEWPHLIFKNAFFLLMPLFPVLFPVFRKSKAHKTALVSKEKSYSKSEGELNTETVQDLEVSHGRE